MKELERMGIRERRMWGVDDEEEGDGVGLIKGVRTEQ